MKKELCFVPTLEQFIEQKAMQATISTLKRIVWTTDDRKVNDMLMGLYRDQKAINNPALAVTMDSRKAHTITDGYDCYLVAYSYLWEKIAVEGHSLTDRIDYKLKNGETKSRDLFQWACVEVRKYIYQHRQKHDLKSCYIEDLRQRDKDGNRETAEETADRLYIKVNQYYDIETEIDYFMHWAIVDSLDLTQRQKMILHYRSKGMSVSQIAEILKVHQTTISKHLQAIQEKITKARPESVAHFKGKRERKKA